MKHIKIFEDFEESLSSEPVAAEIIRAFDSGDIKDATKS